MYAMTEVVCEILPEDKPCYLMWELQYFGKHSFGSWHVWCVMPTRNARNGMLRLTVRLTLKNKRRMIFSHWWNGNHLCGYRIYKAYLRHLFAANEYLGKQIATIHNLVLYVVGSWGQKTYLSRRFRTWKEMMVKNMSQRWSKCLKFLSLNS
jgi:queuine tRNA-ribosyltransferase